MSEEHFWSSLKFVFILFIVILVFVVYLDTFLQLLKVSNTLPNVLMSETVEFDQAPISGIKHEHRVRCTFEFYGTNAHVLNNETCWGNLPDNIKTASILARCIV